MNTPELYSALPAVTVEPLRHHYALWTLSYKHPRKRKLVYRTIRARSVSDALLLSANELPGGYLRYAIH